MRWRLIIEEYSPELIYLKGQTNIVADALSRLNIDSTQPISNVHNCDVHYLAEHFALDNDELSNDIFPLHYKLIQQHQQKQRDLFIKLQKKQDGFHLKSFCGGGKKRTLICRHEKIIIPTTLQRRIVTWYHDILCHCGETRTEQTLRQHFWWPNMRKDVHDICSKCDTCQRTKRSTKSYGHLPAKEAEADPWEVLCVDLIGPYTIKRRAKEDLKLWCVTMIDPATGWFEMRQIPNKEAITIANMVEQTWFTRYPWPNQIVFDRGNEFLGEFTRMVERDYGIKRKPTTTRNPQANSILERIHQTIGNMIRSFQVGTLEIDEQDPWSGILAATMFATRATYHTTTQATPMQLVFGRDAMLNIKFEANWAYIRSRKQQLIDANNRKENAKRISHRYRVGDKVLYKVDSMSKYSENPYDGPYTIMRVNTNGTVRLRMGAVIDTVNIRLLKPYKE
jgi:hypothetical protein